MNKESCYLEFDGYWRQHEIYSIAAESGIYCVYAGTYKPGSDRITPSRLIYVGESDNMRNRVENHGKWTDWQKQLKEGEEICFNTTPIFPKVDRERAESAIIYKHKPACNTDYVDEFPFDTTTISTSGKNACMEKRFTVHRTLSKMIDDNYHPQTAEEYFARAGKLFDEGDYDGSIEDSNEAISRDSGFAEAWNRRGVAWAEKGEYDNALADMNIAINLDPDIARFWYNRGNVFMEQGKYDRSDADYREAIRLDPKFQDAIHNRSFVSALLSTEAERKALTERLEMQYEERLKKELDAAVARIIVVDPEKLRNEAHKNMEKSEKFRARAIRIVKMIPVLILLLFFPLIYFHTFEGINLFIWIPLTTVIPLSLSILVWLFLRWGYEAKTLSYEFYREAIVEDRINSYFRDDPEILKEMRRAYLIHWMEKSPLEVMLTIGNKDKGGGSDFPAEALLDKLTELAKTLKSSRGDS